MDEKSEILIVDEQLLKDKIYKIRGQQVMLDFDLAEIYGYSTSAFNQQVNRNIEKFEGDGFMFQLTKNEFEILMSQNVISSWDGCKKHHHFIWIKTYFISRQESRIGKISS